MFLAEKDMEKNIKDTPNPLGVVIKDKNFSISYTKTNKLITALYMVTDIMDKDEPLRNKLRTLGVEIVSDINIFPSNAQPKIHQILSFLNIAQAMNIISEMNCGILKKEFLELHQSIKESSEKALDLNRELDLTNFFSETVKEYGGKEEKSLKDNIYSKGHLYRTRIGVQKGGTLLKALSDKNLSRTNKNDFELQKKERRFNIIKIIENNNGQATIKDIYLKINDSSLSSNVCSEKKLQRELLSMTRDGVLEKTGEKRWSKYSLKQEPKI